MKALTTIYPPFSILLVGFFTLTFIGCKDTLEVRDPNNVAEQDFYLNEKEALFGLYSIYDSYQAGDLMGNHFARFDNITDNLTINSSNGFSDFEMSVQEPYNNPRINGFFKGFYTVIHRANYVIYRVEQMAPESIAETARHRIIAEATFLRDYAYFILVNLYRDVPFYLKPVSAATDPLGPTSGIEIFQYIESELLEMLEDLPTTVISNEEGRIGRGAAAMLVAMIQLHDGRNSAAAETLRPLLSAPYTYDLYPDYSKLFSPTGEHSVETMFEIAFSGSDNDQASSFSTTIDTTRQLLKPHTNFSPTASLVNSYLCIDGQPISSSPLYGNQSPLYVNQGAKRFDKRDPRLRATVLTSADTLSDGRKLWPWANHNAFGIKKYVEVTTAQYVKGLQNYYVFRFADALLLYAEAQNEAHGPDETVYACVNRVRRRVEMPDYPVGLTKEQMRERIRDERRWEFALEHQRYFDLKRWGMLEEAILQSGVSKKKFTSPRDYIWPIPQTELDRNPNIVQASEWR